MIVDFTQAERIFIACGKTDLRKGIDGLAELIQMHLEHDPFNTAVYLFCGSKSDRFKALYWDGDGFYLLYKRLEHGTFCWPRHSNDVKELTTEQVERLLSGYTPFSTIKEVKPAFVC